MGQTRLVGSNSSVRSGFSCLLTHRHRLQRPELKSFCTRASGIPDTGLQNRGLLRTSPLRLPSRNPCWGRHTHTAGPLPQGANWEGPSAQPEICTCCSPLDARRSLVPAPQAPLQLLLQGLTRHEAVLLESLGPGLLGPYELCTPGLHLKAPLAQTNEMLETARFNLPFLPL